MITNNDVKTENQKVINLPERNAKKDPAGTDPNRYNFSTEGIAPENGYQMQPDNHTAAYDRMLNPDRGE